MLNFVTTPSTSTILVTLSHTGGYLTVCTMDREHGKSQRFLINAQTVRGWLKANNGTTLYDADLNNHIAMCRYDVNHVTIRFAWLKQTSRNNLSGYGQCFIIPVKKLMDAIVGLRVRFLTDPEYIPQCRLSFSPSAHALIRTICANKQSRRALCKALRRNFHWRDADEVRISADWGQNFYFSTVGLNGGLCRHTHEVKGSDGVVRKAVLWDIHT